jgi:drug/metabolite transporter (DMT)-like permease
MSEKERRVVGKTVAPGILLVLLTVLISGVSNFVNFKALQGTNVDAWITVRNVAVTLMLVPLALLVRGGIRTRLTRGDWMRLAVIGVVGGAIPFLLYFHGFQMAASEGGAASASFGYRTLFIMTTVLGVVFLKERFSSRAALAAGMLLIGSALLLTMSGPIWTDGTGYVLLATALWAGEYTLSKRVLRTLPSGTVALGRMGFGGICLLGYLGLSGQAPAIASFAAADWLMLFLSALLLFGFVATWYAGLKTVDVSVATSMLVLAFPITWVLGFLTAKSTFNPAQAAGVVAIVIGVVLAVGLGSLRETWTTLARWIKVRTARVE